MLVLACALRVCLAEIGAELEVQEALLITSESNYDPYLLVKPTLI